jgi:hypothetical protein
MGSTLKLPCVRFVRQVTSGIALSKYGYVGMMQKNAEALKSAVWRKAGCPVGDVTLTVNKVAETDGKWSDAGWEVKPTYTAFLKDNYDCFKQGGDARPELATFCGYLGMVAYRFVLPTVNPGAIDRMRLMIQRDRYLRAGVRVAVEINSNAEPSNDWSAIRGEGEGAIASNSTPADGYVAGVSSWGFLGQNEVPYLMASRPAEGILEFDRELFSKLEDAATAKYLWVYLSCEDMADYWEMYDKKEQRYYSIEGSAALVSACCEFDFATDAEAPKENEDVAATVEWIPSESPCTPVPAEYVEGFSGATGCAIVVPDNRADSGKEIIALLERGAAADDTVLKWGYLSGYGEDIAFADACKLVGADYEYKEGLFAFYTEEKNSDAQPYAMQDDKLKVRHGARLVLGTKMIYAPVNRRTYSSIRCTMDKDVVLYVYPPGASSYGVDATYDFVNHGFADIRFNLWKSDSLSFHSPMWKIARGLLCTRNAFYTGSANMIQASREVPVTGAGSVSVDVSANLVRDFSWAEIAKGEEGNNRIFEIDVEAKVGDVFFITPRIGVMDPVDLYRPASGACGKGACWFYGAKHDENGSTLRPGCSVDLTLASVDPFSFSFR